MSPSANQNLLGNQNTNYKDPILREDPPEENIMFLASNIGAGSIPNGRREMAHSNNSNINGGGIISGSNAILNKE